MLLAHKIISGGLIATAIMVLYSCSQPVKAQGVTESDYPTSAQMRSMPEGMRRMYRLRMQHDVKAFEPVQIDEIPVVQKRYKRHPRKHYYRHLTANQAINEIVGSN